MSNLPALKPLTMQQQAFIEALKGDAKGNLSKAKEMAGYASTTRVSDIVRPIKDHITAAIRDVLVMGGIKAAHAMIDVMDNPADMGAANKIKASAEVLDRIGVVKPDEDKNTETKAAVFILPPKGIQSVRVVDGNVTIDMADDAPKIISVDTEPNPE